VHKDYTDQQLREFLKPQAVQKEFGVDKDTLAYLRECSRDEGKLRGPMFLKDANIVLYQRKSVIVWLNQSMFQEAKTQETQETIKTKKVQLK
jgi:hypothetical protein